nr:hypothetical protein [Corynebacterium glutamicum]
MRRSLRHGFTALLTTWALLLPTVAVAQEPIDNVPEVTADNAETLEDIIDDALTPTTRSEAPNTDLCPLQGIPFPGAQHIRGSRAGCTNARAGSGSICSRRW